MGRLESEVGQLRTELRCALRRVNRLLVIGFFLTYASLSAIGPESRTLVRAGLPLVAAVIGERLPSAPPLGPIATASRYSNVAIGFGLVFGGRPRIARPEASNVPAPRSGSSGKPARCGEGLYVEV